MNDHLITEDELKKQCYRCGAEFEEMPWESQFLNEKHYKTLMCNCGAVTRLSVDFLGSGHDSWDGTDSWREEVIEPEEEPPKMRTLETTVRCMKYL